MAKKSKDSTTIDTSGYDYETLRIRGKDGTLHYLKSNGDAVALAMAMHTVINGKEAAQVARANKLELGSYSNVGQERMAIGNKLRALVNAGTPVTIGDIVVKKLDQRVALPVEKDNGKPAKKKPARRKAASKAEEQPAA